MVKSSPTASGVGFSSFLTTGCATQNYTSSSLSGTGRQHCKESVGESFGTAVSCFIAAASFVLFQVLFHWGSALLSRPFCVDVAKMSRQAQIEWHSRVVSTAHACIVGPICLYLLWFDDGVNADPIWGDPSKVQISIAITAGYLFSDLLVIFAYWRLVGDKLFVLHHAVALSSCYYVLQDGVLAYFANFRQMAELSTPFVNQRWFLEVLGYQKSSRAYVWNGLAMSASFFLARVATMPVYYTRTLSWLGTEAEARLAWGHRLAWWLPSITLDLMNIVWMKKIARGCYRGLRHTLGKDSRPKVTMEAAKRTPESLANGKTD
ncbi:unnamed protein product [Lampetra fluviatilis]